MKDKFLAGCILVGVLLFAAMIAAAISEGSKHDRLMAQCIEDGKKEYECEVILRKPQAEIVPIPVYQ